MSPPLIQCLYDKWPSFALGWLVLVTALWRPLRKRRASPCSWGRFSTPRDLHERSLEVVHGLPFPPSLPQQYSPCTWIRREDSCERVLEVGATHLGALWGLVSREPLLARGRLLSADFKKRQVWERNECPLAKFEASNTVLLDSKQKKSQEKSWNSRNLSQPFQNSGNFPKTAFYDIFIN